MRLKRDKERKSNEHIIEHRMLGTDDDPVNPDNNSAGYFTNKRRREERN